MHLLSEPIVVKRKPLLFGAILGTVIGCLAMFALPRIIYAQTQGATNVGSTIPCFSREACTQPPINGDFSVGHGCPQTSGEAGFCYPSAAKTKFTLSIPINGVSTITDLGQYMYVVYNFLIGIVGLFATVMFIWGGFQYLYGAGGNAGAIGAAKARMTNALYGAVLAIGAVTLLHTISPDIVTLSLPRIPILRKRELTSCYSFQGAQPCGVPFGLKAKPGAKGTNPADLYVVDPVGNDCTGRVCFGQPIINVTGQTAQGALVQTTNQKADDVNYSCQELTAAQQKAISDAAAATASTNGPPAPGATPPPQTFGCLPCLHDKQTCSPNGPNDQCCTGFCGKGSCTSGADGAPCNDNTDCRSGLCQHRLGNSCSSGAIGEPCDDTSECRNGNICIQEAGKYVCAPSGLGNVCSNNNDCPSGTTCESVGGGIKAFLAGTLTGALVGGPVGAVAGGATAAVTSYVGNVNVCMNGDSINPSLIFNGRPGSLCAGQADCTNGFCVGSAITGPYGLCTDGSTGSRCDSADECLSHHCFDGALIFGPSSDFGICTTGQKWEPCKTNDDCDSSVPTARLLCDTTNHRCIPANQGSTTGS